jgi:hypothetical protein
VRLLLRLLPTGEGESIEGSAVGDADTQLWYGGAKADGAAEGGNTADKGGDAADEAVAAAAAIAADAMGAGGGQLIWLDGTAVGADGMILPAAPVVSVLDGGDADNEETKGSEVGHQPESSEVQSKGLVVVFEIVTSRPGR